LAFGGCFFGVQSNHHAKSKIALADSTYVHAFAWDLQIKGNNKRVATNTIPLQALSRRWARVAELSGDLRAEKMTLQ
jgi:hypothetical protein